MQIISNKNYKYTLTERQVDSKINRELEDSINNTNIV
jgi:hypothetical protein